MTHYLVGSAVKRISFKVIQDLASTTTLTTADLQIFLKSLSLYSANQSGLTNVIKCEYQIQVAGIEQMRTGTYPGSTNTELEKTALRLMSRPFFNEEKTKDICAKFARKKLLSIPQPRNKMPTNLIPTLSRSLTKNLLSGNAMGNILVDMTFPSAEKFLARKCRENVGLAATQIILALRCHQMKSGVLPRSLNELVPQFLPSVPLDDFDGKPMRFSPEKRLIYSVGQDLIDSDGQEKDEKNKPLDIPFAIEF